MGPSHTPGESSLAEVGAFPGRAIPRARVPFRPDDMCILDLCIVYAAYVPTLRRCSPLVIVCDIIVIVLFIRLKCQLSGEINSINLIQSVVSY